MPLNHQQKNTIKKNRKVLTLSELSQRLGVSKEEIRKYIEKKWGKESFAIKENSNTKDFKSSLRDFLKTNSLSLVMLACLVFVVYFNSLDNAFLSDDLPEIVNNPKVGDLWYGISSHPFGFIRLIFYWLAYQVAGLNQIAFRLMNVFLHLGSVFLVFAIILRLHTKKIALFSSVIFAVHPVLTEGVSWISGGMYAQYTFFFLLSFLFYIYKERRNKFYFISVLFYLLSFMSHPVMPASLLLVFPLYELVFGNLRKNWIKAIPFAIIVVIYVLVNFAALPERESTLQSVHYQEKGVDNVFVLVPIAVTSYINLIFWPNDLTLYHSELGYDLTKFLIITAEFILFLSLISAAYFKKKHIFFWLAFFFISLLPTLTPFRLNWIVAERYVYLGSMGIFVSVALFLSPLLKKEKYKPLFYIILILLILPLSVRTIVRNIDWHNEDNLWIATGKTSPSSPNTHNNLGDVYGRQGDKQKALEEFQKAIELKPNYADAYHNLGNTYHELNQDDKALESYLKALEYNPRLWQSHQNIAAIYYEQRNYQKALEEFQKALSIDTKNINLMSNLGVIYLTLGDKENAKKVFSLVLQADPTNQFANQGLVEASK